MKIKNELYDMVHRIEYISGRFSGCEYNTELVMLVREIKKILDESILINKERLLKKLIKTSVVPSKVIEDASVYKVKMEVESNYTAQKILSDDLDADDDSFKEYIFTQLKESFIGFLESEEE